VNQKRIIYVSAAAEGKDCQDFRQQIFGKWCDGCWNEWSIEYDVESHTFSQFSFAFCV